VYKATQSIKAKRMDFLKTLTDLSIPHHSCPFSLTVQMPKLFEALKFLPQNDM